VERGRHRAEPGAGTLQAGQGGVDRLLDLRLAAGKAEALGQHPDGDAVNAARQRLAVVGQPGRELGLTRIVAVRSGHAAQHGGQVFHRACHRADVVDARIEAKHAGVRNKPVGGHQAQAAGPGCGQADRAALIAAKGDVHQSAGHCCGRAGRRATGDMGGIVGVERTAKIADAAQARPASRKILHVHLADDCAAGGQQPGDNTGVKVGGIAVHEMRAQAERHPGHADVVLEADGLARERTLVNARHPALADKDVERVFIFGRTVARVAVGDIEGQMLLLDPQLVKALKAVDVLKHARLHAARLGLAEGEAKRSAVCDHILDSGPWQHTPASF